MSNIDELHIVESQTQDADSKTPTQDMPDNNAIRQSHRISYWIVTAILSTISGCFCFYKGIDKMMNYANGDYYKANAYVGGDAYNYIINSNYTTAYFILAATFFISALCMVIIHYLRRISDDMSKMRSNTQR